MKRVYFTDGSCWDCKVTSSNQEGVWVEHYQKKTFFPWHKIDRIEYLNK